MNSCYNGGMSRKDNDRTGERRRMVQTQIIARGIRDERVIDALLAVPRHRFVPAQYRGRSFEDCALPIGYGQTISQPYIVSLMLELSHLRGGENVLEIGTGSGYSTALLAALARQVVSIERVEPLAKRARRVCDELGIRNVRFFSGDGSAGKPDAAPFDVILVWAAAREIPARLFEQLSENGILIAPEGERGSAGETEDARAVQTLVQYQKQFGSVVRAEVCPVSFVPLVTEKENRSDARP